MECTYVHVHSYMKNIGVRQSMHLFITVTSNLCMNKNVVGLSLIIYQMHLFSFWRIMKEKQGLIWSIPLTLFWWSVHCGICLQNTFMLIKQMLSIIYIYWYINDLETTGFIIYMSSIIVKQTGYGKFQHKVKMIVNISGKISNTIWVQLNITSVIQIQQVTLHVNLGEYLTCLYSNDLKDDSELSLCYFQYFDLEKNTQKKSQYYDFIDQLTLVVDSQQSTWSHQ